MTLLGAAALPASASTARADKTTATSLARSKAPQHFSAPISGQTQDGRAVTGTFTPKKFSVKHGQLVARGMLTGNIEGKSRQFHRMVTAKVTDVQAGGAPTGGRMAGSAVGTCNILTLDLGPLHLDLLGLVVDLAPVHLNITAQSGPGNLLGNLLCAVAGLLDNNGPLGGLLQGVLTQLSNLLNQILGQLP